MQDPNNIRVINNFLSEEDQYKIIGFVDSINFDQRITNNHIEKVASKLMGSSFMFDLSQTEISRLLSNYQSSNNICPISLPPIFNSIKDRISEMLDISSDNVFLQILNMESSGKIIPHYDSSVEGFISFKCNISVLSETYDFFIGDQKITIQENDFYTFEASLFKHWSDKEFTRKRILLSYGFLLPYSDLGWDKQNPRIRLSERIQKYFQK